MKLLLQKLNYSVEHIQCLDDVFMENNQEYQRIENILMSDDFKNIYSDISRELYAGGKKPRGNITMARQMILGDIIEYIFTGRAYYYATKSDDNFREFLKFILYCINQILLFDTITVNPSIRKAYIEKLEQRIPTEQLYETPMTGFLTHRGMIIWGNLRALGQKTQDGKERKIHRV